MIYNLYSVLDAQIGYSHPVAQENDGVAMRSFSNACTDRSSIWHSHPGDFHLYCLGSFDSASGEIIPATPRKVCAAYDFVNVESEVE